MAGSKRILLRLAVCAALAGGGALPAMAALSIGVPDDAPGVPAEQAGQEYFVRGYVNYGGLEQDNLERDGAVAVREGYQEGANSLHSALDLGAGTIKLFASLDGPTGSFGVAAGVMGDVVRYTGAGDVPVSMLFRYDADIEALQQASPGAIPESRAFYIDASFAVYEADSGASWEDWTEFGEYSGEALYAGRQFVNFAEGAGPSFRTHFEGALGDEALFLTDGASYKIFASYTLGIVPGFDYVGPITLDALNTGAIGIAAAGGSFTSLSGQFLGFAKTDGKPDPVLPGIPEPASWAMLLFGFGLVGTTLRRQGRVPAV